MPKGAESDIIVVRNNTSITFTPTEFARGKRKEDGIKYPGFPEVNDQTESLAKSWFGTENWYAMLNESIRLWMQQTFNAAIEAQQGDFSADVFRKYAEELSTRGETKEEIENQLATLRAKMIEVGANAESATTDEERLGYMTQFLSITKEVKKYSAILESKKRIRKPKVEDTDDAPANA